MTARRLTPNAHGDRVSYHLTLATFNKFLKCDHHLVLQDSFRVAKDEWHVRTQVSEDRAGVANAHRGVDGSKSSPRTT